MKHLVFFLPFFNHFGIDIYAIIRASISNLLNSQVNLEFCSFVSDPPVARPPSSRPVITKLDSGASRHYIAEKDKHILSNRRRLFNGPKVTDDIELKVLLKNNGYQFKLSPTADERVLISDEKIYNKKLNKKTIAGDILNYSVYEFVSKKLIEKSALKQNLKLSNEEYQAFIFLVAIIAQDQIIRHVGLFPKRNIESSAISAAIALLSRETLIHII